MAARRYEIYLRVLKNIFQHEKRNCVSPGDHVIFFLLYKILIIQQKTKKTKYLTTRENIASLLVKNDITRVDKYDIVTGGIAFL